jgi:hypothetical protein
MAEHNSLEVYTSLLCDLVTDVADCYSGSNAARCIKKLRHRVDCEGISFLTKGLPKLGKRLDMLLAGRTTELAEGFKTQSGVPLFLGWLFRRVLDERGQVRSDPDLQAIKHLRQILYFLYKLELPCDRSQNEQVVSKFVSCQRDLAVLQIPDDYVIRRARVIITRVLSGSNPRDIHPRHGPGAVSTGEVGGQKCHFDSIYSGLEQLYPFSEYFCFGLPSQSRNSMYPTTLQSKESGTAKVVLVPKDSRGPRLISCEPLSYQWLQQGQQRKLVGLIENHMLTRGQVNFTSQEINRGLALQSSKDGRRVTLDMKDASDRVSVQLVKELFRDSGWVDALMATRSTHTSLPDGSACVLHTFAPMGSACCFPVEALVFFALAVACVSIDKGLDYRKVAKTIYVYGDDIILDTRDYECLIRYFPQVGLLFNLDKSCVAGSFRESCGCDAYKGVDVTPTRLRTQWCPSNEGAVTLQSYVALSNALDLKGYTRTAETIRELVESRYGTLPFLEYRVQGSSTLTPPSQVIGWYRSYVSPRFANRFLRMRTRYNRDLQRGEVYGYAVVPVYKNYWCDGEEEMFRALLCGTSGRPAGVYALSRRSRLKRRWGVVA